MSEIKEEKGNPPRISPALNKPPAASFRNHTISLENRDNLYVRESGRHRGIYCHCTKCKNSWSYPGEF